MTTFPSEYLFAEISIELAAAKRARGRCVSRGCRRRAAKKKGGRCNTCSSRLFRLRDDTRYAFNNLKSSARKRGIPFHLDYETFGEFCAVTGYLEMRGKEPHSFSIDRIRTSEPYQIGNIRILTYADNVSHKYEDAAERCRTRHPCHVPAHMPLDKSGHWEFRLKPNIGGVADARHPEAEHTSK